MPLGVGPARDMVAGYLQGAIELSVRNPYNAWLHLNTALWVAHGYMEHRGTAAEELGLDEPMIAKLRVLKLRLS